MSLRAAIIGPFAPGIEPPPPVTRPVIRIPFARDHPAPDTMPMRKTWAVCAIAVLCLHYPARISGQCLGNAGTIEGTVVDQSGAAIQRAVITLRNAVTGYSQSVVAASDGVFRLVNIPPNQYHLEATAANFKSFSQDVTIRNSVPVPVKARVAIPGRVIIRS